MYNLVATEGRELPVADGLRSEGVTPAILDDRDLATDGSTSTGTATRTADNSPDDDVGETLLGGGVDGSLFRIRTIEDGSRPSGGITPTPTPAPDEPTATVTPYVDYVEKPPSWTATLDTKIRSAVTYADGSAYVGAPEGVVAVDPRDGSVRVRVPLGESVDGAPAVGDNRVFAVTSSGRLVAIAADADTEGTDRIDWETTLDVGSGSGPTVVDGTVFVAGDDGRIVAYTIDGDRLWDQPLEAEIVGGTAVTDSHVVVGTEASEVVALDRDGGSIAWRAETRGPVRGTPAVASAEDTRTVYAGDRDGTLSAFAASDGTVRFRYEVGRWLDASPAVGHGAIFIADQTRRVYAVVGD
jgi:outer membrane protein assembly factor BamB